METKAVIQVGDLSINLEGSEAFVSAQMATLADLILTKAREHRPKPSTSGEDVAEPDQDVPKEAKVKKPRSSSGAGAGCAAKVKALLSEDFFATGQSTGQVELKLREQATPYSKSKISAALISMAQRKILRRYQEHGEWLYQVP